MRTSPLLCAFLVTSLTASAARSDTIAYVTPGGVVGNFGFFAGPQGMDFDVASPVRVTQLGVFDSGQNGLSLPITATLYNRATMTPVASLSFPTGTPGTVVGGSRFLALPAPLALPAGFQGSIVAEGYGASEPSVNQNIFRSPLDLTVHGGQVAFVGRSRYGLTPGAFPNIVDDGPYNRYAAGTFAYQPDPGPGASAVAYRVAAGTVGNDKDFLGGSLGMDFNVNAPVVVSQLGAFDSGQDGLLVPITVRLYNRDTGAEIASIVFPAGTPGTLEDGSRFLALASPLILPAGFHGTIVAEGYSGLTERNGNLFGLSEAVAGLSADGGALEFLGRGRIGVAGAFPTTLDNGPANRYAAGTFRFTPLDTPTNIPEPATLLLLSAGVALLGRIRRTSARG